MSWIEMHGDLPESYTTSNGSATIEFADDLEWRIPWRTQWRWACAAVWSEGWAVAWSGWWWRRPEVV